MLRTILAAIMIIASLGMGAAKRDQSGDIAAQLTRDYKSWNAVSLQGKARISGVPVRPTVKVYMEKGKTILLSLSAIFVGEVARVEIAGDSITAINRTKQQYTRVAIKDALHGLPVTVSDVQDILLGRIFLLTSGTLSTANSSQATFEEVDGEWVISPLMQPTDAGFSYGFVASDSDLVFLAGDVGETFEAEVLYTREKSGAYDAEINITTEKRSASATLAFDAPKWGVKTLSPTKIDKSWKRVSLRQFVKTII